MSLATLSLVSIPVGFFQALQRPPLRFLRGRGRVSIPVGFFQALQRRRGGVLLCRRCVSIPVGFFQALQPTLSGGPSRRGRPCFNPCRVFSGLATRAMRRLEQRVRMFQSLSGFFRPCNQAAGSSGRFSTCFNPCRVFSGLATRIL